MPLFRFNLALFRGGSTPVVVVLGTAKNSFIEEYGQIAQSVEQGTENPRVGGSIPPLATIDKGLQRIDEIFLISTGEM